MNGRLLKLSLFSFLFAVFLVCAVRADAGAGVLPYVTHKNDPFILLSLEKRWPNGPVVWTDMGGGGRANKRTAAKEAFEELMGVGVPGDAWKKPFDPARYAAGTDCFLRKLSLNKSCTWDTRCEPNAAEAQKAKYTTFFANMNDNSFGVTLGGRNAMIQKLRAQLAFWKRKHKQLYDRLPHGFTSVENFETKYSKFIEKRDYRWFSWSEFCDLLKGRSVAGYPMYHRLRTNINAHKDVLARVFPGNRAVAQYVAAFAAAPPTNTQQGDSYSNIAKVVAGTVSLVLLVGGVAYLAGAFDPEPTFWESLFS